MLSASGKRCGQNFFRDKPMLRVWETHSSTYLCEHVLDERVLDSDCPRNFCLSPDGSMLAWANTYYRDNSCKWGQEPVDDIVKIVDAATSRELLTLLGHDGPVNDLCFSPDGLHIATASEDHTVRVWDVSNGEMVARIEHEAAVCGVWFSPDGTQVVSDDVQNTLRIWDAETGVELRVLDHQGHSIRDICFSPDGTRIVGSQKSTGWFDTVNDRCAILIWNAQSGELLEVVRGEGDIKAIAADVNRQSFRLLVRGGETIVESPAGEIVARYPDVLNHIASHPDGRTWAGAICDYLALIRLEGADHS